MGNAESSPRSTPMNGDRDLDGSGLPSFPGSTLVESALQCGNLDDDSSIDEHSNHNRRKKKTLAAQLLSHAENCVMSPQNSLEELDSDSDGDNGIRHPDSTNSEDDANHFFDEEYEELGRGRIKSATKKLSKEKNNIPKKPKSKQEKESVLKQESNSSSLLARSLMSEVNNPNTMSPNTMTQREKKLLKAQEKARQHNLKHGVSAFTDSGKQDGVVRPIGSPSEGVGQPSVLNTLAHALTSNFNDSLSVSGGERGGNDPSVLPPNSLSEHRAAQATPTSSDYVVGKHTVIIGLSLSRRSALGHPDTVTRQTAFDFNELQDRECKYVSSTDPSGWKAGGGERGDFVADSEVFISEDKRGMTTTTIGNGFKSPTTPNGEDTRKVAAPDTVHIPIIQIDAESSQAVDAIISALARGEIFIPHMAIIPEALSVNGVSPPDLVVRFGTERNEDLPPDEWPNWCLEFMHNQLYEYFHGMGARWMKRPFSITLAKKVRWKTVKHMNRYFSHAERVIDSWRERGPQYLDPQLAYIDGGATPEEVARPHGIYLLRNGVPTNYFAPNFNPPYTTKMTRSLLFNVLGKSWDKKRREWSSLPIPKLITPSMLVTAMCGCGENQASGFVATEATLVNGPLDRSTTVPEDAAIRSLTPQNKAPKMKAFGSSSPSTSQKKKKKKDRRHQQEDKSFETSKNTGHNITTGSMPRSENQGRSSQQPAARGGNDDETNQNNSAPLSPRLELQISSSSASFFDGVQSNSNEIPSPPLKASSDKEEMKRGQRELETKQGKTLQKARQSLVSKEQRQDQQQENRPHDVDNGNDENSGDTKNNEIEGGRKSSSKKKTKKVKEPSSKLASDEEWLNDVGKNSPKTECETMSSTQSKHRRHIELRSSAPKVQTSNKGIDPICDSFRDGAIGPGSPTVRSNNSSKSSRNALLNKSNDMATLSMEYSVDESTHVTCDKSIGTFDSTLLGQNFAADSKSILSAATKETIAARDVLEDVPEKSQHTMHSSVGTGASSYSTADDEPVPSDEELFAVGWAKALDPNSGSYYYFTLDRKQTVWDNPLAPPVSPTYSEGSC